MSRTTQSPSRAELTRAPQDNIHLLMSLIVHASKWLAQPGPRDQPG
jgi:hypothetical protein